MKEYAMSMFQNNFSLPTETKERTKYENATSAIEEVQVTRDYLNIILVENKATIND